MPIYEYRCESCGHQLEAFQKFSDAPLLDCPACHQPDLQKLISATSFQLKGSGWYVTDIRDKGKPKPAEAPSTETNTQCSQSTSVDKTTNEPSSASTE